MVNMRAFGHDVIGSVGMLGTSGQNGGVHGGRRVHEAEHEIKWVVREESKKQRESGERETLRE